MKPLVLQNIKSTNMNSTGLNEDLANEVLRIKDNLVMYPDERPKQTPCLAIIKGQIPADRPPTATEWLNKTIIGRGISKPIVPTFPKNKEEAFEREKLTAKQIQLLRTLSYKPRTEKQHLVSLAA